MSDEECEDLPSICVNSTNHDSSWFAMPAAGELAAARARELRTERELRRLRAQHEHAGAAAPRSDSSGSEGEAALAAAVGALRVKRERRAAPAPAALLAALRAVLPPGAARRLHALAAALELEPAHLLPAHCRRAVEIISALVATKEEWSDEEVQCHGAVLASALLAGAARARPGARFGARRGAARALVALLDRATPHQVEELGSALCGSLSVAARLELSDALRGGGAGAEALGARALRAALTELAGAGLQAGADDAALLGAGARAWPRLDDAARWELARAAGRALAAPALGLGGAAPDPSGAAPDPGGAAPSPCGAARAQLLSALAPRTLGTQRPDRLQVLVAASKLRLLFGNGQAE